MRAFISVCLLLFMVVISAVVGDQAKRVKALENEQANSASLVELRAWRDEFRRSGMMASKDVRRLDVAAVAARSNAQLANRRAEWLNRHLSILFERLGQGRRPTGFGRFPQEVEQ